MKRKEFNHGILETHRKNTERRKKNYFSIADRRA